MLLSYLHKTLRHMLVITCFLMVLSPNGIASENAPTIEPAAQMIVDKLQAAAAQRKAFSFEAEIAHDEVMPNGQNILMHRYSKVSLKQPNNLFIETTGNLGFKRLWYDGKKVTLLNVDKGLYVQTPAPDTTDAMLDFLKLKIGYTPTLVDFLYSDTFEGMLDNVTDGFYVGESRIQGELVDHLAFANENIDWQIWVTQTVNPWVKKLVIDYKNQPSSPSFSAVFSTVDNVNLATGAVFAADVSGANQIDFLRLTRNQNNENNAYWSGCVCFCFTGVACRHTWLDH